MSRKNGKKVIAVTGAAGYLGHRLLAYLEPLPWVERIIALDLKPIASDGRTLSHRVDVTEPGLLRAILAEHGVTHLVHAAFLIVKPPDRTEAQMRAANVEGSRRVIKAALEYGVEQFVFVSSVAVYGYHPGHTARVLESASLQPTMVYGKHKAEVEAYLREASARYPRSTISIVRSAAIAGPSGRDFSHLRALTAQPVFVVADRGGALTQAIHEDDAASFVGAVLQRGAPGIFNAAPDDQASWSEIGRLSNRPLMPMPRGLLNQATRFNNVLPALNGFTREIVDLFAESLVVDNRAAHDQLGWSPRYATCDAFQQMFQALGTAR